MSKRFAVPVLLAACLAAPAAAVAATDQDRDGLPDRWERRHELSTSKRSAAGDPDRDRLTNRLEFRTSTNPRRADTDRDGFSDGAEVTAGTNPRKQSSRPTATTTAADPPLPPLPIPVPGVTQPPAPDASYTYSPANPQAGQEITFDGSASTCAATPCSYTWEDIGPNGTDSSPLGSGQTMRFTFQQAGTKYVRLTVADAQSRTDTMTRNVVVQSAPPPSAGCDRNATPSTFGSEVSAASAGQTICLASGTYGTWQGTNKAITILAASGASPSMRYSFTSGDAGFTMDGMTGMGGSITNGARDITIRNSTFNTHATFDGLANSNILFDRNTHNNINSPSGSPNARLGLYWGSSTPSGLTIQNSTMTGGDSDGVHTGVGVNVLNNTFTNICDQGGNHTDNVQFEGAVGGRIAGNYVKATCTTQGITSYDGGTNGVIIEDNVVDISRPWGIEFYADKNSIIRHNTLRYYADANCDYGGMSCGQIALDRKSSDPAGTGTQVYDNVATVSINNGSTASRNDHNQNGATIKYTGPMTTWAGYKLASDSAGRAAASDGQNLGARIP